MLFSEAFGVEEPEQYDWFDPTLERDTLLFVDPFLLFKDEDEHWKHAHDKMMDYFHDGFETLARSGLKRSHQFYERTLILMEFPEPKEFRLGFATKSSNGSGAGRGLAQQVVAAMGEAIKRGMTDIAHFEELGILVEGINRDRISDITCNLLKPEFIEYTQHACHSLGIPMQDCVIPHGRFNSMRRRWEPSTFLLPVDPSTGKAIILTPKRFLGELPTLSSTNWHDHLDNSLRNDLNLEISNAVDKRQIITQYKTLRKDPDAIRSWVRSKEETRPKPYDVDRDPKLLWKWQKVSRESASQQYLETLTTPDTPEELLEFVREIVSIFRHWVEDRGGWRVFWRSIKDREFVHEENLQLVFLGHMDVCCKTVGIMMDREVETGRGPVDFAFTGGNRIRVLLEMKKLSHGRFWNGLRNQTPAYMRSQQVDHAIFLAIRDSDSEAMQERWMKLEAEADLVRSTGNVSLRIEKIDALPRESASKI